MTPAVKPEDVLTTTQMLLQKHPNDGKDANPDNKLTYTELNALLNFYSKDRKIQFEKDREAARRYFLDYINPNTVYFSSLEEKLAYLIENDYYETEFLDQYDFDFIKNLYKRAYDKKHRFTTFMGAYKFYSSYALKTFNGQSFLERYEDRCVAVALFLGAGDEAQAVKLLDEIVSGRFQPATPTYLNAGRKQRGELVSCFLIRTEDNMESISRIINASLQLSKRGGGVGISLTNLREEGAPIKKIENQSSGVIPVMKLLEDSFSYANQMGARNGSGVAYLSAHHPDILKFLDTKRENADEKIRIKTLSLGVVMTDVVFQAAKENKNIYLFSPYDVERVYGKAMSDISITEKYDEMCSNPNIKKTPLNARELFQRIAEVQLQSGYPYLVFEDTVNRANPIKGRINMSNLCSEILQVNTPSTYKDDLTYKTVGRDISCNLGSMNIVNVMRGGDLESTVNTAIRALTFVSDFSNIESVPSIREGNRKSHAVGLGAMGLHGFFASQEMHYGSEESLDFTSAFFAAVAYYSIKASNEIAIERNETFFGFKDSKYATGEYFDKYVSKSWKPKTDKVKEIFKKFKIKLPSIKEWEDLKASVMEHGMYNAYLRAVAPTGSISYVNNATASIHPITSQVEVRKEGKLGRVYFAAPEMTNDNIEYFQSAYDIGYEKLIDVYAAATEHTDQGLSCTLFFKEGVSTRVLNKAQNYAYKKGIKTLYYIRQEASSISGTDTVDCVSCSI